MRRWLTLLSASVLLASVAVSAWAAPTETSDTDNDSAGALDVDKITHDHSDDEITYTATTEDADPYAVSGSTPATLAWAIDFDGDAAADGCVIADVDTADALTGQVLEGDCATGTAVTGDPVTVTRATNVFTLVVPRTLIDEIDKAAADTDDAYDYRMAATSTPSGGGDAIVDALPDTAEDDPISHDLAAAQATPTPTPTSAPTPAPTDDAIEEAATTTDNDTSSDGGTKVLADTAVLPDTGDAVHVAEAGWPAAAGPAAVLVALALGVFGAYKLIVRKDAP